MIRYDEMRISLILCGVLALAEFILLIYGLRIDQLPAVIVGILLTTFVFINVFSLRVQVTREDLILSYGIGLFKRIVPLGNIQSVEIVPNQFWTWVYNPALSHVVALRLRGGSRLIVGVGDAARLREILSRHS